MKVDDRTVSWTLCVLLLGALILTLTNQPAARRVSDADASYQAAVGQESHVRELLTALDARYAETVEDYERRLAEMQREIERLRGE